MNARRALTPLLVATGMATLTVAGCGGTDDAAQGWPVRVVNGSKWDARVLGCPMCGKRGLIVAGDPERAPDDEDGGPYFGWNEERARVTYRLVVNGVESTCPVIDPRPSTTEEEGAIGTPFIVYLVDASGKCVVGPSSMADF
jgi:hypothetical protein